MRWLLAALVTTLPLYSLAEPPAKATLRDAQGTTIGTATLSATKGGVKVIVSVSSATPGKHGLHVHAVGKCEGPDFKSAGDHFNPAVKEHGLENPQGAHMGDMPNLVVDASGVGHVEFLLHGASLKAGPDSLFGEAGTALVLHGAPDDMKSDPAGNAGARVACGVVERAR
jgi:Cu-Zn family superoxide dismutase